MNFKKSISNRIGRVLNYFTKPTKQVGLDNNPCGLTEKNDYEDEFYGSKQKSNNNIKAKKPKLSAMIITYNHVKYIAKAIEGILNQKTEYEVEIVIIEDCSTDGTQDIILEYQKKYPDIIKAYLNPVNIGTNDPPPQKVFFEGFKKLKGDYVSILEGDDYWSSPFKVQEQISFLEAHKDFVACSHNTVKIYDDKSKEPHRFLYWENIKKVHDIHDFVAMTSFFHISSLIYRNVLKDNPPTQFSSKWSCEIFNTMAHMQHGKLFYINKDMSIYRQHKGGSYSNMSETKGRIFNINSLRRYNKWLKYQYLPGFCHTIYRLCEDMIKKSDERNIPPLTFFQKIKYKIIGIMYKIVGILSQSE